MKHLFQILFNRVAGTKYGTSARVFALAQIVCVALCAVSFVMLAWKYAVVRVPEYVPAMPYAVSKFALPIMLAGTVGYGTNWLAIRLLFHPIKKRFGFIQGLIPKKQAELGVKIGDVVAQDLLTPEMIASKATIAADAYLQKHSEDIVSSAQDSLLKIFSAERDNYCKNFVPGAKAFLASEFRKIISEIDVPKMIIRNVPAAVSQNSAELADAFISVVRANDESIRIAIREKLEEILPEKIADVLRTVLPGLFVAGPLAGGLGLGLGIGDYLLKKFGDRSLLEKITAKMSAPISAATAARLADESIAMVTRERAEEIVLRFPEAFAEWVRSGGGEHINDGLRRIDLEKSRLLDEILTEKLPKATEDFLRSENFRRMLKDTILPRLQGLVRDFLSDKERVKAIIAEFEIASEVAEVVRRQDPEKFEKQIDSVAAEQLGAIQVLGFILGALIGLLQCFI